VKIENGAVLPQGIARRGKLSLTLASRHEHTRDVVRDKCRQGVSLNVLTCAGGKRFLSLTFSGNGNVFREMSMGK